MKLYKLPKSHDRLKKEEKLLSSLVKHCQNTYMKYGLISNNPESHSLDVIIKASIKYEKYKDLASIINYYLALIETNKSAIN